MACSVNEEYGFSGAKEMGQLWASGESRLVPRVPDAVIEGETGKLVEPDDDEAMAAALDNVLRNNELRRSMGEAGARRARSLYHVDTIMKSIESLYTELTKR